MTTGRFPWALVTFDIDGTLTQGHGWEAIARAFDRLDAYRATQARFAAGEIGEDEHLGNLLSLVAGRTEAELDAVLAATPKIAGISESVRALRDRGARVALLTHNPAVVCRWYATTFGFEEFEGAPGPEAVDGRLPPTGAVRADKVGQLRRLLGRLSIDPRRTVHVGDSRSDAEVFSRIGGGVALNSAIGPVRDEADLVADVEDLRELVPALGAMRPRDGTLRSL